MELQEIKIWNQAVKRSETLKFYARVKEVFGIEYNFKLDSRAETRDMIPCLSELQEKSILKGKG